MTYLKQRLFGFLLAFLVAAQALALEPSSPPLLSPQQQQAQAAKLTAQILSRYHYKPMPLDNALSEKIFDRYLKALDPERMFFTQADIDRFGPARTKLGEAIKQEDLRIPFEIFNVYEKRISAQLALARELLKQDFDFSAEESYQYERSKEPWAKSEQELRDLWRKRVKNDWLRLKLAGKADKAIRETLDKRYSHTLARAHKSKSEDVFQLFLNSYASAVEPHTDYLGPRATEEFDISMKLSLVGIGAVLQERDEYTTIRELVAGGPAALSGKLNVGDRIVAVGQGQDGAAVDVVGWRVDDVVELIRGTKDTVVRLEILPAEAGIDAKPKQVALVRNKISLAEQAAKKSVIEIRDGEARRSVGVITLPAFYQDFEARRKGEKEFRSAARDVARLLEELKREKVDAVLVDLRSNGGGSLDEAVELTGLFTGKGPVVQERNSQGNVKVESVRGAKAVWTGPLAVLINRGSASASEIFAAAIQDYGRGIIIGEPSFGKGTVQTMISLDQFARGEGAKLGGLKMTIAQFFRINGGTTQLRGVTPDIRFPALSDPERFGESSFENALPWTQIKPANFTPAGDLASLVQQLQSRHSTRIAKDRDFQNLLEDITEFKVQRQKKQVSLNESERRKERESQEQRFKQRAAAEAGAASKSSVKGGHGTPTLSDLLLRPDTGLQSDERNLAEDLAEQKARKNAKDVWLNEAANIVGDAVDLLKMNAAKVVTRAGAGNLQ